MRFTTVIDTPRFTRVENCFFWFLHVCRFIRFKIQSVQDFRLQKPKYTDPYALIFEVETLVHFGFWSVRNGKHAEIKITIFYSGEPWGSLLLWWTSGVCLYQKSKILSKYCTKQVWVPQHSTTMCTSKVLYFWGIYIFFEYFVRTKYSRTGILPRCTMYWIPQAGKRANVKSFWMRSRREDPDRWRRWDHMSRVRTCVVFWALAVRPSDYSPITTRIRVCACRQQTKAR